MPEHTYLLHHIAVYACLDPEFNGEEWADQPDHTGHECHSPEMPPSWGKCFDTIYFWTVGGQVGIRTLKLSMMRYIYSASCDILFFPTNPNTKQN